MSNLTHLTPQPLWDLFAQICAIPHPSHHEEALAQHIMLLARQHSLSVERDHVGNILIRKPATLGMENRPSVALQAHLDMVAQKNQATQHEFNTDPIQPYIDGEWVKATGTTLGADNGIGMASALAVLFDDSLMHGPLEVLLTMTEEAGMKGAFGLQAGWLKSKILINTDSEQEGEIYMGCAGGVDVTLKLPLYRGSRQKQHAVYQLSLQGLRGGHSGCDIHLGRGNANKLLARFLAHHLTSLNVHLIDFHGGTVRNAIPREAFALLSVADTERSQLATEVAKYNDLLKQELGNAEPHLSLTFTVHDKTAAEDHSPPLTAECCQRLLALINTSPNGVIRMSDAFPNVVETSLNLGIVNTTTDQAECIYLVRSQVDSSKKYVTDLLHDLAAISGANVEVSGAYPGWKPDLNSPLMGAVSHIYQQLFHRSPTIKVIHAGLECGLFKQPYPTLDMVSIGPTIQYPHSPDERVNIVSVEKYWLLLTTLLASIPTIK